MNVRKHVLLVAPWIPAAALVTAAHGGNPVAAGAGMAAGSIACDIDHPGASTAKMWGPVSGALASVVAFHTGGHRGLTHARWPGPSVFGAWLFTAFVVVAATAAATGDSFTAAGGRVWAALPAALPYAAAFLWAFVTGAALAAVDRVGNARQDMPWPINLALSAAVGAAAWFGGWSVLPLAPGFALGVAAHLFGDMFRDTSRAAHAAVAASCITAAAVTAWWLYYISIGRIHA